jgi:heme exporter protein CcmD
MVEGGWPYVWGAYALTIGVLCALALIVWLRLRHWARQARDLDQGKD